MGSSQRGGPPPTTLFGHKKVQPAGGPGAAKQTKGTLSSILKPICQQVKSCGADNSKVPTNILSPFAKQPSCARAIEGADSKRPLVLGRGVAEANIVNGHANTLRTAAQVRLCYMPAICIHHTWMYYTSLPGGVNYLEVGVLCRGRWQLHFQVGAPSRCGHSNYN